jgi:hypothetical protein
MKRKISFFSLWLRKNGVAIRYSVFLCFIYYKNILKLRKRIKNMKIGLEIKNISRAIKPKKDDVIIFDGKEWYITTKKDLFKEYEDKIDAKLEQFNKMIASNADFKKEISGQMVEMSETIKKFIKTQGE